MGTSVFVGGEFTNAANIATADRIAAYGPLTSYKPDGRIRKGTGSFVGNNVYNGTGFNQTRIGSTTPGHVITFGISGQNDSNSAERIRFAASGTVVNGYTVRYFNGSTDITSGASTPATLPVAGARRRGRVPGDGQGHGQVEAAAGSSVTRLVTVRSDW